MNTNLCQIQHHMRFDPERNNGFWQSGRQQLTVDLEFAPNPTGQRTALMVFTATRRKERCLGFAIEALGIASFPFLALVPIFKLVDQTTERLAKVNRCGEIIANALLFTAALPICFAFAACTVITAALLPMTLAVAAIFESIRIAHYAKTHTTIQVEGRKYYVHTQKYRIELQNTFQIQADELSSPVYKNMQTLLGQFEQQQLIPTQLTVDRLRGSELNSHLSNAFTKNEYEEVIKFIHWGANPNLIFSVKLEGKPGEFGCLFALVCKRLDNDKENTHLLALYELLRTRIPEELQLTHLLEDPDTSLIPATTDGIAAKRFTLERARQWAEKAPKSDDEEYALLTLVQATDLQKTYLKSDTVDPNNLLVDTHGLFQYEIGAAAALAHDRFPEVFADSGEKITIYTPQERDYARPGVATKSANNT